MKEYFNRMVSSLGFEKREGQEIMSNIVAEYIQEKKSCFIEAGTGIGKTLAYLIPAYLYAKKNNTRVVISTNTINLQEQILEKDIPLLESIVQEDIDYGIVKGRSNYICGNRLQMNSNNENLFEWFRNTKTGDKSEINFFVSKEEWADVCCDRDFCNANKCAKTNDCYYYIARKKLSNKQLLVINHSLLFSSFNFDILPEYDILIIDEAHNIESIARSNYEVVIRMKETLKILGLMHNNKTNQGAVQRVINLLKNEFKGEYIEKFSNIGIEYYDLINRIYSVFIRVFGEVSIFLSENNTNSIREVKVNNNILDNYYKLLKELKEYSSNIDLLHNDISSFLEELENDEFVAVYMQLYAKLSKILSDISFIIDANNNDYVKWFKIEDITGDIQIISTPLDVSVRLREELRNYTVIMTSATLRVNNSFKYIKDRLGLDYDDKLIDSPFDYDKNMKIILSKNQYNPNSNEYLDYCIDFINNYMEFKEEGIFVLCTSYKQLDYICSNLKIPDSYKLLKQGDMSRSKLIDNFKEQKAILVGTDSFWEGVDVKGDSLKAVIILKLPFQAPDDPILESIIENMKKNNRNSFIEYQLPYAIIKLRQGIGRLIRSKEDSGSIIILDNRVYTKKYGKQILDSLPHNKISIIK